jgi:hypothetical protein
MQLAKFSTQLAGKDPAGPPYRIPARDLDANFAKLRPLPSDGNNRQYAIEETPEGWRLRLFPDGNEPIVVQQGVVIPTAPTSGTYVLGSVNGTLQWIATESCE